MKNKAAQALANKRWKSKTQAEKNEIGRALTAARLAKYAKKHGKPGKEKKPK